jgi:DNA-binding NarL/FixJ family response regulator
MGDTIGVQNAYALRLRILVQQGDARTACALETPDLRGALPFMLGEVLSSKGLALASAGRFVEAQELVQEAMQVTSGVETRVLCAAVRAVCALNARKDEHVEACERLIHEAFETAAVDPVVCAYRGNPYLLEALLSCATTRERAFHIVQRSGDLELATKIGKSLGERFDVLESLTSREREIFHLISQGLSNRAIAGRLFISEATVKLHARRVYAKLGVHSRAALAWRAAQYSYAASAAGESAIEAALTSTDNATSGSTGPKSDPRA